MAICKSRKSMHSVMNNGGYCGLLNITRDGNTICVPETWLFEDGRIKKYALAKVNIMFKKMAKFNEESFSIVEGE